MTPNRSSDLRVAVLTNAPAPYRTGFFNELGRDGDLLMVFDTKREPDRQWSINEAEFSFSWVESRGLMLRRPHLSEASDDERVLQVPLNTLAILRRFRPDVVVSDELGLRTAWAALFCRLRNRPLIVWWEGIPHSDAVGRLRSLFRVGLLKCASRVWANGIESVRSLTSYGVPLERIDAGMTGMDTLSWRTAVDDHRLATRDRTRQECGLEGVVLLFVGRLTPLKGVFNLLRALSTLSEIEDLPPWSLLCVGAGPSSADVEQWSRAHPHIPVAMPGFVEPADLAKYYAAADVFVQPSLQDVWSLVCLEAVVAGLPQVVSELVGAAQDLVTSEEVGDVVDPHDVAEFANRLGARIRQAPRLISEHTRDVVARSWSSEAVGERARASVASVGVSKRRADSPILLTTGRPQEALVTISVDDGHPSDRRVADLLAGLGYAATFYIPARNPERPVMVNEDVRAIAAQFEVGGHSVNHVPLTGVSHDEAWREIVDGKAWLEDVASVAVRSFCYPRGKFSSALAQLVRRAGFSGARTTMGNIVSKPMDPFRAGTTTQASPHRRVIEFRHAALEKNWQGIVNFARIFRFQTDWAAHFETAVRYVTTHGGVAHLWLHSWELDTFDQWGELDALLRHLKSAYEFRVATNGEVFATPVGPGSVGR